MKPSALFGLLFLLALSLRLEAQLQNHADTTGQTYTFAFGGLQRSFLVHLPKNYNKQKPYPVVLILHGGASNAKDWMTFCGMNETADKNGFIAVYPNGTGKVLQGHGVFAWNGGPRVPGGDNPELSRVNDVGFINALLNNLERNMKVDTKRIYATGMSMGAMMVYRLGSELSKRIAAIAPIAGMMATEKCTPQRPVSVIHFHGTDDQACPYKGGKGKLDLSKTDFYSVDYSIRSWVKTNACKIPPKTKTLPNKVQDSTTVSQTIYGGGKQDSEVILYTIKGGGHTWPMREFGPELKILGPTTYDISANDLIWAFFKKHAMK